MQLCELLDVSTKQHYWEEIHEEVGGEIYEEIGILVNSVLVYRFGSRVDNLFKLYLVAFSEAKNSVDEEKLSYLSQLNDGLNALLDNTFEDCEQESCETCDDVDFELDVTHHQPSTTRTNHRVMFSIPEEDDNDDDEEYNTDENSSDSEDNSSCDELDEKNYSPQQCVMRENNYGGVFCDLPSSCSDSFESFDSSCLTPREVFDCNGYNNILDNETNSTIHLHDSNNMSGGIFSYGTEVVMSPCLTLHSTFGKFDNIATESGIPFISTNSPRCSCI